MSAHCFFVDFEIIQCDEIKLQAIYINHQPSLKARGKTHPINTRQQSNARRRKPHLNDLARLGQIFSFDAQAAKTKLSQCRQHAIRIVCSRSNPKVEIARISRMSIRSQRVPPNDQVFNLV